MRAPDVAFLAGRLLFGGFFVMSGLSHLTNTAPLAGAAASRGVPLPELAVVLTGVLLLVGGASVALGIVPRLGLLALIVFLIGVTPVMHAFWTIGDQGERMVQMASFLRNAAFLGAALVMLSIPEPWAYALGSRARATRRGARRPAT